METPPQKPILKCPNCGSESVAQFLYGFARLGTELQKEITEGRIKLGGSTLAPDSPRWHCNACRHEWGRMRVTFIERDGRPSQMRVD